jgi:hypothetical protein
MDKYNFFIECNNINNTNITLIETNYLIKKILLSHKIINNIKYSLILKKN